MIGKIRADTILLGMVITVDPEKPFAEAVAVSQGQIIAVGRASDVCALEKPGTTIIDCRSRCIVPGFIDAHCHFLATAASRMSVDCSPRSVMSIADIKDRLKSKAVQTPLGEWIRAVGYDEVNLSEKRHPDRNDIDEVVRNHPVRLIHRSGHACVLNSMGMTLMGITTSSPDPPGGIIERDFVTGEPTGLLLGAMNFWDKKSQGIKTTDLEQGIRLVQAEYLSNGITSFEDATSSNNYDDWGILNRFNENGCIKSHTGMLVSPEAMGDFIECGMATSELGQVRICGVKVIVDETDGHVSPDQDTLEKILCEAHAAGFATAQHAIEGKPLEVAVEVIGKVKARTPGTMHRDRIEHCSLCSARIRGRIKNSKLVVVSQPGFIYQNGDRYLQTVKKSELPFLYCFRSFLRDGIMIAAGSDSPFGNPIPLDGIYAAVTRRTESGKAVTPNESIGIMEAVAMWTRSAAWAATLEDRAGIIAPGKRADLVVLSDNLLTCAEERLKEIKVLKTMIDGVVVWDCGN